MRRGWLQLVLGLGWGMGVVWAQEVRLQPVVSGINNATLEQLENGEWEFKSTGFDPYFYVKTTDAPIDLERQPMLAFEYFSASEIGESLIFVGDVLDIPHLLTLTDITRREGWSVYATDLTKTIAPPAHPVTSLRIRFGQRPGITLRFRAMHARARTPQEVELAQTHAARLQTDHLRTQRLKAYLAQDFPSRIEKVMIEQDQITIVGKLKEPATTRPMLAEVAMWQDVTDLKKPVALWPLRPTARGEFEVRVKRSAVHDRERLLSGWCVVSVEQAGSYELLSHLRYATEQVRETPQPAPPRSLKGLGGCPFGHPDMQELNLASVTMNIILNDFFADGPGEGRTVYRFAGNTYYLNDATVASYDHELRIAAANKWMVSMIVLMPPPRAAAPTAWISQAAHPEAAAPGIFVLPDFTTPRGVHAYAAAMKFVTERYSRADERYGRIHHWIMHNEINSGFYWANAGTKSLLTYMEIYQKSMRVADLLVRQHDAHAKVLISLDHCWTYNPDPRAYPALDLLETLALFSRREGDFPWGVAFHPYAQDLWKPRTWEDAQAILDLNTPFLTYRNLEVLDAFVALPRIAYRGMRAREIQLTEQGINSPDYSEVALREQAAGLAYAWQKIKRMKHVTAFQYHLWTDEPSEGGLRLGLRKFANDATDPHGYKPAWYLFKALDTEREAEACRFALPLTGVTHWDEVWQSDWSL